MPELSLHGRNYGVRWNHLYVGQRFLKHNTTNQPVSNHYPHLSELEPSASSYYLGLM